MSHKHMQIIPQYTWVIVFENDNTSACMTEDGTLSL